MTTKKRVAVLISGRGSNMTSLIEAARASDYPAQISLVVSNRPEAGGLERARAEGIEAVCVDHRAFADRENFEREIDRKLRHAAIEVVCLAGFMRVLTPWFVTRWVGRMINIHPSLLPLFRGVRTHRQALDAGVRVHGCTVHFVLPELDAGPIIAQACVPVHPGDGEDDLAARVLVEEHRIYPPALASVAAGEAVLEDGRCVFHVSPRG
ncbi:MAG: phosphoribosylglycinamide formyltransferase [Salinarimonadaceae bacterium]|nr:MAG: phosphoribosylglycinamide formyltransferase [Salinarimonadaceae bacterium]